MMPGIMSVREGLLGHGKRSGYTKGISCRPFRTENHKGHSRTYSLCQNDAHGGVNADNVGEWIKAGAVAVGAGSSLTAGAKTGDYKQITETGKKFVANIKAARAEMSK